MPIVLLRVLLLVMVSLLVVLMVLVALLIARLMMMLLLLLLLGVEWLRPWGDVPLLQTKPLDGLLIKGRTESFVHILEEHIQCLRLSDSRLHVVPLNILHKMRVACQDGKVHNMVDIILG
jgi:hypothetical protein